MQARNILSIDSESANLVIEAGPGRYAYGATGDFGGGTLKISWLLYGNNPEENTDAALTSGGGFEITLPGTHASISLENSTAAAVNVVLTRIS